jgi:hypothetical protein
MAILIKKNLYTFHSKPEKLVGYDHMRQVPIVLLNEFASQEHTSWDEIVTEFEQSRPIFAKDLDVALRAADIYTNRQRKNLWPVGGEVEMALLRSPKHQDEYLKYEIGSRLQSDPRYIDILPQLDPVFIARYLGNRICQSSYVDADFKRTVLEMISDNVVASLTFASRSRMRNPYGERKILKLSEDDWQDIISSDTNKSNSGLKIYKTAWEYYLRCLESPEERNARSDARAAGFDV